MESMRPDILVFIDWYYPGYKAGGPIRSCMNLVAHLGKHYSFYIVTRNNDYTETEPYPNLETGKWLDGPDGARIRYLKPEEQTAVVYSDILAERSWHLVYINSFFSPLFSILPLRLLRRRKFQRVLLAPRGMLSPEALRIKRFKKQLYLYFARYSGLMSRVEFQATSPDELNHIRRYFRRAHIHLAPNLPALQTDGNLETGLKKTPGALRLISIGRISPEKNTAYLFPLLKSLRGMVELTLLGPVYNQSYWEECREQISRLPEGVHVHHAGSLPNEEAMALLRQHHAFITPTLGENFGHGIIESLQHHRPVIISDRTPWREGKGMHVFPLDRQDLFCAAIQQFIDMNQSDWENQCTRAYETAAQLLNTADSLEQNRKMFDFK